MSLLQRLDVYKCLYCQHFIYPEENRTKPAKRFCRNTRCAVYYSQYEVNIRKAFLMQLQSDERIQKRNELFIALSADGGTKSIQETVCLTFGKPVEDVFALTKRLFRRK